MAGQQQPASSRQPARHAPQTTKFDMLSILSTKVRPWAREEQAFHIIVPFQIARPPHFAPRSCLLQLQLYYSSFTDRARTYERNKKHFFALSFLNPPHYYCITISARRMSKFMSDAQLPLHGIKVIDFGQPIAGSAVGMVLGDLGATVISIDCVGTFAKQPPYCATLNRNKLCVELDLKSSEGLAQALELISAADVVIDSFRPGTMQKLGIDYSALCQSQPALITMSLPGFASNDPVRRDWKGIVVFP